MSKLIMSLTLVIVACSALCFAQKLPNIQENEGISKTIKVDGKITEPDFNFEAFNKATRLSYSIMNDDKNLYLALKSDESANIAKILMGGITFTFNPSGEKKKDNSYAVTFPVISRPSGVQWTRTPGGFVQRIGGEPPVGEQKLDTAAIAERRKKQLASFNEIKVTGFSIPDTLVSIYNKYGISTAINYDEKGNLIYEFSVPLQLMGLKIEDKKEFSYNVQINGRPIINPAQSAKNEGFEGRPGGGAKLVLKGGGSRGPVTLDPTMLEPTDFWGKYIPAAKR
jgi:hypothetical protein